MTLKRLAQTTVALLVMIGMAVSASEMFNSTSEVCTNVSIMNEVSNQETTTKPVPDSQKGAFKPLEITEYTPTTVNVVTTKFGPRVQKLTLTGTIVEREEKAEIKVVEEVKEVEETKPEETVKPLEEGTIIDPDMDASEIVLEEYVWDGEIINSYNGTVAGPNGKETYYNLNMSGVVKIMERLGYDYEYWVREDGAKMYGPFIMVAADLSLRPRGSIIKTSLGWAMVCDTGDFVKWNPTQLDIAVAW